MKESPDLDKLRNEIKDTTLEIMRLTGKRLLLAKKVGEIKRQKGLPIEDLEVEKELKQVVLEKCREYGIESRFALKLLSILFKEAKRVQKEMSEAC
jgi:chorismate mutase